MSEFFHNFHLLRPWALLFLLLPLTLYWRYFRGLRHTSSWEQVCDRNLLDFLLIKGSSAQRRLILYLGMIGFVGAIVAASGPTWQKQEIPSLSPENPVMVLLNLSTDMAEKDLTPSRLARAKFEISDLLQSLTAAQTGLIVYTDEPYLVSPITDDSRLIDNLLPMLEYNIMPSNGDRPDRAIELAVAKLKAAGYVRGNIVLFASDIGQRLDLALEAAAQAKAAGYDISVVAVSRGDTERLRLLAQKGDGALYSVSANAKGITALAQQLNRDVDAELKKSENLRSVWRDYGYYLTILPLLCALYFFRKGILAVIFCLGVVSEAQAGFFLNDNQEGLRAFNQNNFAAAAQKFKRADWKASALYRQGDFSAAAAEFAKGKGAEALYNQGNALAKAGKIDEAIKNYEEVLQQAPNHEDAKFNLDYLKQQKQNQQNQSSSDQNQKQDQNQQSQGQQSSAQDNQQQSDQNQPQSASEQNQSGQQSDRQQPDQDQQEQNNADQADQNSSSQNEQKDPQDPAQSSAEQEQAAPAPQPEQKPDGKTPAQLQNGKPDPKYNEEVQAREQQYREIPEDPGGLLRAFIRKEYQKNRYR